MQLPFLLIEFWKSIMYFNLSNIWKLMIIICYVLQEYINWKNYREALKMQSRGMEFYKPETQKVSAPQPIQHENLKVSNKSK